MHFPSFPPLFLMFCSLFPCSSGCWGQWFHSGGGRCYQELSATRILCRDEYDIHINGFFCLPLPQYGRFFFYVCKQTLTHSFLIYAFVLHAYLLSVLLFTYFRYCFFFLFIVVKTNFVQLQIYTF